MKDDKLFKEYRVFFSMVSHDLQEPVRTIINYAEYLKDSASDKLQDEELAAVTQVVKSARRLSKLLDVILHYAQLGTEELDYMPVSVDSVITQVVEDLYAMKSQHDVNIITRLCSIITYGNETRLYQLFQNLISNAIKYSNGSDVNITCEVETENIAVMIRDEGIGISAENTENIFKLFKRYSAENGGTGAGLAIAKKIAEQHNGSISVDSVLGEYTTFTVRLPKHNEK